MVGSACFQIKHLTKTEKIPFLIALGLCAVTTFGLVYRLRARFETNPPEIFKPKTLGTSSFNFTTLPQQSHLISSSQTLLKQQLTYSTKLSKNEIKQYYRKLLGGNGNKEKNRYIWSLKNDKKLEIVIIEQPEGIEETVVSVSVNS